MDRITVVTPFFNASGKYGDRHLAVERFLNGLRRQTVQCFDAIICGDPYASEFKNVIVEGHNNRLGKILNYALKQVKTEYVFLCQADYLLCSNFVASILSILEPDTVYGFGIINSKGKYKREIGPALIPEHFDNFDHVLETKRCVLNEEYQGVYTHVLVQLLHQLASDGVTFSYCPQINLFHPEDHTLDDTKIMQVSKEEGLASDSIYNKYKRGVL